MNESELVQRTKEFAKEIIGLCRILPNNREGRLIGDQLFRSGTSVAANYVLLAVVDPKLNLFQSLP
jgi:hypothetical protein